MQISDQIIAILDDLCRRFGIVIDWSEQNIIPYLEDLSGRFIQYEIYTSIAWCVVWSVVFVLAGITWSISGPVYLKTKSEAAEAIYVISMIIFFFALIFGIIVCAMQAFHIIECYTIPEKVLIEFIVGLMEKS